MALKPDAQSAFNEWLNAQESVMSPEDFTQLKKIYGANERAQEVVAPTVMMRADFSRRSHEQNSDFQARVNELNTKAAQVAEYDRQLQDLEAHIQTNFVPAAELARLNEEKAQLERYRAHTEAKIRGLGLDELINGLEEEGELPPMPTNPNDPKRPAAPNGQNGYQGPTADRFVTRTAFEKEVNQAGVAYLIGNAALLDLDDEFRQLTGKGLPNRQNLIVEAAQAGKPLVDYIESKFEIAKLRVDKANADREAEINRRAEELAAKKLSEARLPIGNSGFEGSGVLSDTVRAMNNVAPGERPTEGIFARPGMPGRGAQRAAEAFLSGKYRNQQGGPYSSKQ